MTTVKHGPGFATKLAKWCEHMWNWLWRRSSHGIFKTLKLFLVSVINFNIGSNLWEDNVQSMTTALETTSFPKWKGEIDPETNLGNMKLTELPNIQNYFFEPMLRNQLHKSVAIFFESWQLQSTKSNIYFLLTSNPNLRIPSLLARLAPNRVCAFLHFVREGMRSFSKVLSAWGWRMGLSDQAIACWWWMAHVKAACETSYLGPQVVKWNHSTWNQLLWVKAPKLQVVIIISCQLES